MYTLFGHRGNKNFVENTFTAIQNCEYEGIEVDVRLTLDRKIVLHHDDSLERIYKFPFYVKDLYYQDVINRCETIVNLQQILNYCKYSKKKLILDVKEELYQDIIYIIDSCIHICNNINFNLDNITFLCWVDILKPRKNIRFIRGWDDDFISYDNIYLLKNDLLFDGICIQYSGTSENINDINKIKSKNMLVNIYTNKNIQDIKLNKINPDYITL